MADMDKVTVIGFKASGKTCYLAGMYDTMSYGIKNFSLIESDSDQDYYLQTLWENISDGNKRNWPVPNDEKRSYSFVLCHSFDKIIEFEWLDYPGGALVDPGYGLIDEIKNQLAQSSCLLLLVNGQSFAVEADSVSEYKKKVRQNLKRNGDLVAIQKLSQIGSEGVTLPPIAIIVSKSDLIKDQWIDYIGEIIRENFEAVYGENGEDRRIVMVTAVTLGEDVENGGDADPENIEQPIAYAVLSMLCKYVEQARLIKSNNKQILEKKDTIWRRIINPKKLEELRNNIEVMDKVISKFSKDAIRLLELFEENKCLYVNGVKKPLRKYFQDYLCIK